MCIRDRPAAAYTEQDGHYTNLEGLLQKAYKASYPPGDAKEDWKIINELSEIISDKKLFTDKYELVSSMLNYLNLYIEKNLAKKNTQIKDLNFISEKINVEDIDYYYTNVIARASKTMFNWRSEKNKNKLTGTEG